MSVMEKRFIDVLNCNANIVTVRGMNSRGYLFEPGSVQEPFVIPLEPAEIKYIHSGCKAFRNGVLRFREEDQDEVYEALGVDKDAVLFTEQIEDILLQPTAEGLTRLIEIASSSEFERVRGCYYRLVNAGKDVSNKVRMLVERRYEELRAGKLHTALSVTPAADRNKAAVEAAVEEMNSLRAELNEYKELVQKFLARAEQSEPTSAAPEEPVGQEDAEPGEPAGRRTRGRKKEKIAD